MIKEDTASAVPANSAQAGGGGVAGLGGASGEPPGIPASKKKRRPLSAILTQTPIKRKPPTGV